ncbi:hypothetical protein GTP91_13225 [Rugamonas sp. FT82W]|uniref:Uncharacterized protein n=1 Tax=Duganella vulcania TaxID=2692166 RepID=A0A845G5B7_9BURK|nr:hypothetical protein [Duganella vulcania]MYM88137.1 hypothetical protein [Duganella vulcania]
MTESQVFSSPVGGRSAVADMDVIPANLQVNDVQAVFAALPTQATREYYECKVPPTAPTGMIESHFKGVAAFGDKLIFTHTDLDPICPASHGKYLVGDVVFTGDQGQIDLVGDTAHAGWCHPCGAQACGSFMAMGIQKSASGSGADTSEIQIYDTRNASHDQPIVLIGTIPRPNDGINGVAMTREDGDDGKYIVAGVNGRSLTIYRSTHSSLLSGEPLDFNVIYQTDEFSASGAGLALITQVGGDTYLISMNADDDGSNSEIALYQLFLKALPYACVPVPGAKKSMPVPGMSESITLLETYLATIPPPWGPLLAGLLELGSGVLNSSFRWGKGLSITTPDTIEIYATDRNVLPISHIPQINSKKDFSLVVWACARPGPAAP